MCAYVIHWKRKYILAHMQGMVRPFNADSMQDVGPKNIAPTFCIGAIFLKHFPPLHCVPSSILQVNLGHVLATFQRQPDFFL